MGKLKRLESRVRAVEPRRVQVKRTEAIYGTWQWKEARAEAMARYAYRCAECNVRPTRLFVDHITELADGGAAFDQSNLRPLCGSCHTKKTVAARSARVDRA